MPVICTNSPYFLNGDNYYLSNAVSRYLNSYARLFTWIAA